MKNASSTVVQTWRSRIEPRQTATHAAKAMGLDLMTLRRIERGLSRPDPVTAERIAAYYSRVLGETITADGVAAACGGYATRGRTRPMT